ncbi:hypothetical protein SteCoe_31767 [Stentor coeruleus]|uniref:Dynein attachment factor N-terminal domain-containing protein n=1 Tax=Stentor coeruleus TaxID=5963 RepID=A0A1R2B0J1_9CILI|nr:hypothetical protein SteCoe_31767 [Stentor coeruleus]
MKNIVSVTEREEMLKRGLEEENTKKNINDSKFRAVAQHMDYSGFHQMVLGANLKPTKAGEAFNIGSNPRTIFNTVYSAEGPIRKNKDNIPILTRWRRSSNSEKLLLLQMTEELHTELEKFRDFMILAEIITLLETVEDSLISTTLNMLKQIQDFRGSRKILTQKEKKILDLVLEKSGDLEAKDFFSG